MCDSPDCHVIIPRYLELPQEAWRGIQYVLVKLKSRFAPGSEGRFIRIDLLYVLATRPIESVDIRVSGRLERRDGGTLAIRGYGELRDQRCAGLMMHKAAFSTCAQKEAA
jgi:hypothetical protein